MSSQLKQESFEVSQISKNVHVLKSYYKQKDWEKYILFLSDLHWDTPKMRQGSTPSTPIRSESEKR